MPYVSAIQMSASCQFLLFLQTIVGRTNSTRYAAAWGHKKVLIRAKGVELVIAPAAQSLERFFLNSATLGDDFMTEHRSQCKGERESFEWSLTC